MYLRRFCIAALMVVTAACSGQSDTNIDGTPLPDVDPAVLRDSVTRRRTASECGRPFALQTTRMWTAENAK